MGWEYEDLFNNRVTDDGSFLSEPSFIPVGKMGYRRRTTVSGPRIDAEVFPVFGRSQNGDLRRAKSQVTREAQQRANDERSRIHRHGSGSGTGGHGDPEFYRTGPEGAEKGWAG